MPMYELSPMATDEERRALRIKELNAGVASGCRPFISTIKLSKGEPLYPAKIDADGRAELHTSTALVDETPRSYRLSGEHIVVLYDLMLEELHAQADNSDS